MPAKGAQHGLVDVFGFFVFAQPQPGGHGPGVGGGLAGLGFHGFFVHGRGFHILPGGGKVRDTGKEVLFSGADELAVKVAEGYARKKQAGRVQFDREHLGFDVEIKKNPAHQCSAHER